MQLLILRLFVVCFNSTMVRLKVLVLCVQELHLISFNSTMVRLKDIQAALPIPEEEVVSIPLWYD